METKHLIDGIVQQTTILIAQLSTAAGIRAPLAKLADQVFLNLARELEAHGVKRKVAADMFGLALRSYQLKVSRLSESASEHEGTLWEAVFEMLRQSGGATRKAVLARFSHDSAEDVAAVLLDLVQSGLASRTGRGLSAYYQPATAAAGEAVAHEQELDAVANLVWLAIYDRKQTSRPELIAQLGFDPQLSERAIDLLLKEGRVSREVVDAEERLCCHKLTIPVGSEQGWEAAVFDHFRAVATAIAAKLLAGRPHAKHGEVQGGTTLTFGVYEGHPYEHEVYGLLQTTRTQLNALWDEVSRLNEQHPIDPGRRVDVTFYFGQSVVSEPQGTHDGESEA
jgi:hypothetical protein